MGLKEERVSAQAASAFGLGFPQARRIREDTQVRQAEDSEPLQSHARGAFIEHEPESPMLACAALVQALHILKPRRRLTTTDRMPSSRSS